MLHLSRVEETLGHRLPRSPGPLPSHEKWRVRADVIENPRSPAISKSLTLNENPLAGTWIQGSEFFAFSPFLSATSIRSNSQNKPEQDQPHEQNNRGAVPTMPNWDKKLDSERNDAFLSRATRSAPNADANIPAPRPRRPNRPTAKRGRHS